MAIFVAVEFWLFYVALEPFARRVHPHALVSWTRLLRGNLSDPLVGRHVLLGMSVGTLSSLCTAGMMTLMRATLWKSPMLAFYGGRGCTWADGPPSARACLNRSSRR